MSHIDVNLDGLRVMVGIPAGRDLHPYTLKSLIATFDACSRLKVHAELGMVAGSSVVQWARDEVVDTFLKSKCNRLFWIDSDIVWNESDFIRMLAMTKLRDVVCAAYPAKDDRGLVFFINYDHEKDLVQGDYGLIELNGVGLGFTCMTRAVVEKVVSTKERIWDEISQREMAEVFRVGAVMKNGKRVREGEDMAFFSDIRAAGYKVWLDPEVSLGHMGQKQYMGGIKALLKPDTGE